MASALRPSAETQQRGAGRHAATRAVLVEGLLPRLPVAALCKGTPLRICLVPARLPSWNMLLKLFGRRAGKGDSLGLK